MYCITTNYPTGAVLFVCKKKSLDDLEHVAKKIVQKLKTKKPSHERDMNAVITEMNRIGMTKERPPKNVKDKYMYEISDAVKKIMRKYDEDTETTITDRNQHDEDETDNGSDDQLGTSTQETNKPVTFLSSSGSDSD